MKPKIKNQKIYPKIILRPIERYKTDELELEFREEGIFIHAYIDGAGNDFLLPYESIKGVVYK